MIFVLGMFPGADPLRAEQAETRVDLVSPSTFAAPGQTVWVGVRLRPPPGWRTFWENPGEAGLATKVRWVSPERAVRGKIRWPWPERRESRGIVTHVLDGETVLWTPLTLRDAVPMGAGWVFQARVDWLECRDDCRAGRAEPVLFLPTFPEAPSGEAPVPSDEQWDEATARAVPGGWELVFTAEAGGNKAPLIFFPRSLGWAARPPADPRRESASAALTPQVSRPLAETEAWVLKIGRPPGPAPKRLQGLLTGPIDWRGPGRPRAVAIDIPLPEYPDIKP